MSIDNRVVHLGFDNAQFEAGVSKSMSTLDKLKTKLEFKNGANGLSNLQNAANNLDFSALIRGIETLEYRFSAMGIAGMNVVNRITDYVINGAKKIEAATIGQIKAGGWSRAMNLANAQFTIEGLKLDWDEMLKSINYGVQDTAYGLDSAAKAASSLAASGVGYKESIDGANDSLMHTSLRAISGVAAMTNSSYDDIAHVFTTVAGQGRLMSEQLNSLATKGMNAAATLGEQLGKTEAEVREMVSKGQINFEMFATAMDDAFGEHAKEANKTFTGALSNMKAALSRIGAIFATPIINKTNTFFIALTDKIKEVQKALNDTTDESGNKVIRFAGHFAEAWEAGVNVISELIEKLDLSWFDKIAEKMDSVAIRTKTFFDDLKFLVSGYHEETGKEAEDTTKTLSVTAKEAEAAKKVINGMYGNGAARSNALTKDFGAESAKRIQDYVNSVVAAGYDYDKASIKIEEASTTSSSAMADLVKKEKDQRKVKFHAVVNQLTVAFSNLWRAGKNIFTNITKIAGAISSAFRKVFNIADGGYSGAQGIASFAIKIADFTEKLILSEDAVKKITNKFEYFFGVIKTGLTYAIEFITFLKNLVVNFINARKEISELPQAAQDVMAKAGVGTRIFGIFQTLPTAVVKAKNKIVDALNSLKDLKIPFIGNLGDIYESIKDGTAWEKIKDFGTNVWNILEESFEKVDWSNNISGLFNFIINVITGLDWGGVGKLATLAFVVKTLFTAFQNIKSLGDMAESIAKLPKKIGSVFSSFSKMLSDTGKAISKAATSNMIWTIAKSVALVAGVIIAMANVDQNDLYSAAAVMVVIAFVLAKLAELVDAITNQNDQQNGLKNTIASMASSIKLIYSMAVLIAAIGVAVLLFGGALAVIKTADVDGSTFLILVGIVSVLVLGVLGIVEILKTLPKAESGAIKGATSLAAVALVIDSIALAVLSVALALKTIDTVSLDGLEMGFAILLTLIGGVAIITGLSILLAKYSPGSILAIAAVIASIGFALSTVMVSIGGMMVLLSTATNISNDDPSSLLTPLLAMIGIISIIVLALVSILAIALEAVKSGKTAEIIVTMLTLCVVISSIAGAMVLIGLSFKLLESLNYSQMLTVTTMMAVMFGGIILLIREISSAKPEQLLSAAAAIMSIGGSMFLLAFAIGRLSRISFASSGLLVAIGVISLIVLIVSRLTKLREATSGIQSLASDMYGIKTTIGYIIGGIIAFALAILVVAEAFKVMDDLKNVSDSLLTMIVVLISIASVVALLTLIASKSFNSGDALFAVGAAFIMIAASMLIFAHAVEKMSSTNGNLLEVVIIFGALAAIMVILAAVSAKFPKFGEAMTSIGKAFLYAGIGAALVGAGIFLVVKAINDILPVFPLLIIDANMFFSMLEEHYPVLIIITIIVAALTVAIVALGVTVGPIIKSVAELIAAGAKVVLNVLDTIASTAKNFVSNMSTKGKATLITLIMTLCGALSKATPEILKTIGDIIIKVLGYLGSIIGTIASALLEFIINLINGLANAIRMHSNRIAASIFNLLYSLIDVVLAVLKELVNIMFGNRFGGKVAEFLGGFLDYGQEELDKHAAKMLSDAEAADAAKKSISGYNNELEKQAELIAKSEMGDTATNPNWTKSGGGGHVGSVAVDDIPQAAKDVMKKNGVDAETFTIPVNFGYGNTDSGIGQAGTDIMKKFGVDIDSFTLPDNTADNMLESANLTEEYFGDSGAQCEEAFTNEFASEIASEDSQTQVANATEELMDVAGEVIDNRTKELAEDKIPKAFHSMYSSMVVNTYNTKYGKGPARAIDYVMDSIADAVSASKANLAETGGKIAKAVDEGFTDTMGIDSPSKLFYKNGLYVIQGLQNGIKENTYQATNAMSSLSDQMINSFGNPLLYTSKIASGEIEYDPTIRPVMDMSSAQRTAFDVNSLFNRQVISLGGLSGQIAYDMTNLNGSNAAVVSEIQGLREDMDYMTEELTNMQIVMDTGALVGSTVGAYDQALGKQQVRYKRGSI